MPSTGSRPSGSRANRQPRSSRIGSTVPSEIAVLQAEQAAHDHAPGAPTGRPGTRSAGTGRPPAASGPGRPGPPPGGDVRVRGDPTGEPVGLADELAAAGGLCAELGPGHAVNLSAAGRGYPGAGRPRDPRTAAASPFPPPKDSADDRGIPRGRSPHPDRPVRRRPRRGTPRRPRRARDPRTGRPAPVGGLGPHRRRDPRLRQPGRRGQPQRGPDGGAARRAARGGARQHGQPALRLRPGRPRHRRPLRSWPARPTWWSPAGWRA